VSPDPHDAADAAFWNTKLASGAAIGAPAGGQVLQIRVKGCAVEDTTAPKQTSQMPNGPAVPVNTVNFETLAPQSDGSYKVDQISAYHVLPFCSNSSDTSQGAVNTSTVTTFEPLHMCISPGELVNFYDIGGFVSDGVHAWYPQGVPFKVLAPVKGSTMQSFVYPPNDQYGPGYATLDPNPATGGFAQETGEELLLQVVMGTGDDAYGLCPGGHGNEPTDSNSINCVYDRTPEAGATPCPGWGPSSTGGSGSGTGTGTASGSGTGKVAAVPGPPAFGHAALFGVGQRRARLRFAVNAGSHAPLLRQLTVTLARGLRFAGSQRQLARGVSVATALGARLRVTLRVVGGQLVITLTQPAATARVTIAAPAIGVSGALGRAVHYRHTRSLPLAVLATDAAGTGTRFAQALAV
jgi:hypothetical protein